LAPKPAREHVRLDVYLGSEIDFVGPLLQTPIEFKYVSQKW